MHKTSTTQELGLTFNPVPTGAYTYVVEYFPPFFDRCQRGLQVNSVECQQTNLQKVSDLCQKHRANSQVANGNSRLPHD